jgi:hypothetical protein
MTLSQALKVVDNRIVAQTIRGRFNRLKRETARQKYSRLAPKLLPAD